MKIPKDFILGAVNWTVKVLPDMPDNQGHCDARTGIILVEKNSNKSIQDQAYCHELIHALFFNSGVTEHDEVLVDKLASGLHQYIERTYGD